MQEISPDGTVRAVEEVYDRRSQALMGLKVTYSHGMTGWSYIYVQARSDGFQPQIEDRLHATADVAVFHGIGFLDRPSVLRYRVGDLSDSRRFKIRSRKRRAFRDFWC